MKRFKFSRETGKKVTHFDSHFIMTKLVMTDSATHVGMVYLEPGDMIGFHETVVNQLLLVIDGEGEVRGETGSSFPISAGEAVFWEKGEGHETKTAVGLTALVVESETLQPHASLEVK
ncbi:cupin domain-containing protein [Shouchella lonarensis]|uniref:Cupin domain-containing protein n=1 Tax=Shouchella lonarensis TaxID=1464122 RepID=A0A1G6N6X6_9BACI|nr:cupin domain-containing protein [Shouchella lonarensis]SDC63612.1 Cupin domain-containing protein [Shouchella lonarensis]